MICGNRQDGARADVALFAGLEEATRPPPLVFAAIYALLLVAIPAARGQSAAPRCCSRRSRCSGCSARSSPPVYDWRYVVPMFGFAAAAAGIGGWAVIVAARGRLGAPRDR